MRSISAEEVQMTKITVVLLTLLAVVVAISGMAAAEEEVYVTGVVTAYIEGKSITVKDGKDSYSVGITEDTEVYGDVGVGAIVEVEAKGNTAIYIGVISTLEEEPVEEEPPAKEL